MEIHKSKYGSELRINLNKKAVLILNTHGQIGVETSNEDLWNSGWRLGFTPISRFFRVIGLYIFIATK